MYHSIRRKIVLGCVAAILTSATAEYAVSQTSHPAEVVWDSPSQNSAGSMPIGNGDIGANVRVEPSGDLVFYLSKTDAWSENARLLKLGRVRVKLDPPLYASGATFTQTLDPTAGAIRIGAKYDNRNVSVQFWVDANRPVVHVEIDSDVPVTAEAKLELWRTERRELNGFELHSARGLMNGPAPVFVEPDVILPERHNHIVWRLRNERSVYPAVLNNQHLGEFLKQSADPLRHRTFGGWIEGAGFATKDDTTLITPAAGKRFVLNIRTLTATTDTPDEWLQQLAARATTTNNVDLAEARKQHALWWADFWDRHWMVVSGPDKDAPVVSRGYALQRWVNACGGRGAFPIKFNGSIFTVDANDKGHWDADYRRWGGCYWHQNTRHPYWSMLASGDFDLMMPLFAMYRDAMPLGTFQAKAHHGHAGAYFPETMYFWGTYANTDFGWGNKTSTAANSYIRYYWSGSIELLMMGLDYYDRTEDATFAKDTLLPLAEAITTFYDQHWSRGDDGKIYFAPAAVLETWHLAANPLPEIVGLRAILDRLLALPDDWVDAEQRAAWKKTLADLPAVPMATDDKGKQRLSPAQWTDKKRRTGANPELYAVFPYRAYGVGKPGLEVALESYGRRLIRGAMGWQQDAIEAAYLGQAHDAHHDVVEFYRQKPAGRFPAFWGPNWDWIPDQCHGSVPMVALQRMAMQCEGDVIRLLPAWPKTWNVSFKLHAPKRTTVEGTVRDGKIVNLKVTPESRRKDVVSAWELPGA